MNLNSLAVGMLLAATLVFLYTRFSGSEHAYPRANVLVVIIALLIVGWPWWSHIRFVKDTREALNNGIVVAVHAAPAPRWKPSSHHPKPRPHKKKEEVDQLGRLVELTSQ